jgi:hypothetical protein
MSLNHQARRSSPEQLVILGSPEADPQVTRSTRRQRQVEEYDARFPGARLVQLEQVRDRAALKRAIRLLRAEQTAIIDSAKLTEMQRYQVAEVEARQNRRGATSVRVKLRDPTPHLERIGRHLGLAGYLPTPGPAGVLLDGEGGVTIYLPQKDADPHEALPLSGDNGGPT